MCLNAFFWIILKNVSLFWHNETSILQIQLQHLALLSTGSENDVSDPVMLYSNKLSEHSACWSFLPNPE